MSYTDPSPQDAIELLESLESPTSQANIVQSSVDRERSLKQQRSTQIQLTRVTGTIQTTGVGEAVVDVAFPVMFAEKPAFSFGGELGDNQPLVDASFPTVSAVVHSWVTEGEVVLRYKGAKVAIVTTGPAAMLMSVLVHFEAKAFQNPNDTIMNQVQPTTVQAAPPVQHGVSDCA